MALWSPQIVCSRGNTSTARDQSGGHGAGGGVCVVAGVGMVGGGGGGMSAQMCEDSGVI